MDKLLLIEDNIGDTVLFNEYLKEYKKLYEIICCFTLNSGIDKIKKEHFDLILLDLNLPDSMGLNTIQELMKYSKEIPVIVFTYTDDELTWDKIAKLGVEDFIIKGQYDGPVLNRRIRFAIERHRKENVHN